MLSYKLTDCWLHQKGLNVGLLEHHVACFHSRGHDVTLQSDQTAFMEEARRLPAAVLSQRDSLHTALKQRCIIHQVTNVTGRQKSNLSFHQT